MESYRGYCFSSSQFEGIVIKVFRHCGFGLVLKLCLLWLKEIPEEVWECGSAARVLDVSENFIREVPVRISSFVSMHVRMLVANVYFKSLCLVKLLYVFVETVSSREWSV